MPKKANSQKTSRPQRAKTAKKAAAKPAAKKAAAKRGASASKRTGASRAATAESVKQLVDALQAHPQQKDLVSAGQQQKDQLLRSLIPLYLARSLGFEVTSGTTSRFWSKFGVSYAAPNAAKALRIHTGYASETKKGRAITAKGIRYVEDAIARG
jgi:AraC-like DNA-binding protein